MASPFDTAVAIFEYGLVLAGVGLLAWIFFHPAGRVARTRAAALPLWDVSVTDFFLLAWAVAVLGLAGQLLLRLTLGPLILRQPEAETFELVAYGSMFHLGAILTWLLARAYLRRRHAATGLPGPSRPRVSWLRSGRAAVFTLVAAMPLITVADLGWERLLKLAGLPVARQELVDLFLDAKSPALLGLMIVLALFVAPISEEIVFRAGLFRFLRARTPRWVALVASAGLFALVHANWVSFLPLFVLGVVFAESYERTGSIAVPILAHALFNLNSLLLVLGGAQ